MKALLSITFLLSSIVSFSQTDIIEMRSRNASLKKYERKTKLDHIASNFGMAPPSPTLTISEFAEMSMAVLDSVEHISETVAIMYTSDYCTKFPTLTPRTGTIWQAGTDTVYNHPLFSKSHSLDSVKAVLDRDYIFNLPADSIKFIGFDNGEENSIEEEIHPVKHKPQKKNSIGWELLLMLITPVLFVFGLSRFLIPSPSD